MGQKKANEYQLTIREKPNHQPRKKISVKYAAIKNKDYCHTTVCFDNDYHDQVTLRKMHNVHRSTRHQTHRIRQL